MLASLDLRGIVHPSEGRNGLGQIWVKYHPKARVGGQRYWWTEMPMAIGFPETEMDAEKTLIDANLIHIRMNALP
jgi:hypothetical protein